MCVISNLQLLAFMNYDEAKENYNLIKEDFPDNNEKIGEFDEHFESIWFSLKDSESTRYSFSLGIYYDNLILGALKKI